MAVAANWIRGLWAGYAASRPEVTVELFSHGGITPQPSIILTLPGTTLAGEVVILGGHQDSIRSGCSSLPGCIAPGADDDASGIATLSEVIRVAMAADFRPQRTVHFIARPVFFHCTRHRRRRFARTDHHRAPAWEFLGGWQVWRHTTRRIGRTDCGIKQRTQQRSLLNKCSRREIASGYG